MRGRGDAIAAEKTWTVQRPPEAADLRALDERYSREDFAEGWDDASFAAAVMIMISIERWIAWTDWD